MKRHEFVEETAKNDRAEISPDSPPADRDDAFKKLIRSAKKRGYVTRNQVNCARDGVMWAPPGGANSIVTGQRRRCFKALVGFAQERKGEKPKDRRELDSRRLL
jgi:hypothetical protein